MFGTFGPELDAELAYRRESLSRQGRSARSDNHWIKALVMAATLDRR